MGMDGELTDTKPAVTDSNEEGDGASNYDANERLAVPYGFPHSRVMHYQSKLEANSICASKSTDEMTEREIANASDHVVDYEFNMPASAISPTAQTATAPKSCYNYFAQADFENSCNSLSDYPTDEQTSNTLNTLNSFHRNMFGVDEAPWKGSPTAHVEAAKQPVGHNSLVQNGNTNGAVVHNTEMLVSSNRNIPLNRRDFDPQPKKNTLMDRLHILQMAKKRMAVASHRKVPNEKQHPAVAEDAHNTACEKQDSGHKMQYATKSAAADGSAAFGQDTSDASPKFSRTDVIHDNELTAKIQESEASPNVLAATMKKSSSEEAYQTSTTLRSGYDGHSKDSKNVQFNDPTKLKGTATWNEVRADKSPPVTLPNHQDLGSNHDADEDSFLEDAIIENAAPLPDPTTTDSAVSNCNVAAASDNPNHNTHQLDPYHSPYPQDYSDESLPNYNIHASSLSLSTMTPTNQHGGLRNVFANVGGDMSIYSPSCRTLINPANSSFETSASPLTVVASGGRPRILDSREPSVASTVVDEMILNESYVAVRNLGAAHPAKEQQDDGLHHVPVIQPAAITPVRNNANSNQSIDSYSYNQAFLNSDNITSNPEIRSLTTTTPDPTNLHEEYSFCPSSKHSSAFSTLTDEYLHYYDVPRRTGITAVPEEKESEIAAVVRSEEKSPELRKNSSGPVDVNASAIVTMENETSFRYESSSLARPPPPLPQHGSGTFMYGYGNSEHLSSIIQYPSADVGSRRGEGEGYVDEEAAMRYASLRRSGRGFFSSPPCMIRLLVLSAMLLLMVSVASVTFGIILQKDNDNGNTGSLVGRPYSAQGGDGSTSTGSGNEISGSDATGFVPAVPGSFTSPTFSPTAETTIFPTSSTPSKPLPVSQAPSPASTLEHHMQAIDEPVYFSSLEPTSDFDTSAPSNKPTPSPIAPSSSPTIRTMSPTPFPSPAIARETTSPSISDLPSRTDSQIQTRTIKIQASRDTYIKENSINWNYGSSDFLRVDEEPRSIAVIAFDIDPIDDLLQSSKRNYDVVKESQSQTNRSTQTTQTMKIIDAKLRLYAVEESWTGGTVYALSDATQWKESELTWDNARDKVNASGEVLIGSIEEAIDEGVWYEVSVTSAFDCCVETVGTIYLNMLIRSNATDGVTYASKEYESGMFAPELILTFSTETESSKSPSSDLVLNEYTPTNLPTKGVKTVAPTLKSESTFPTYFPTISTVT
eukprot:CCRYP_012192-RA/>CCRYP_012192-RA protein AED:0.07 eAED:0.07 QI:349/1/1/1/0.66/0.75/4/881/1214